jgi:predicted nuclease of predicted toxin-antitoxin system
VTFVADESVDKIVDGLRGDGHTVVYVAEMDPGVVDDIILDLSHATQSVLITADKDFAELIFRQRRHSSGVLLIRLAGLRPATKASLVAGAIRNYGEQLGNSFSVLSHGSFRIHRSVV